MLERPEIPWPKISACLSADYTIDAQEITFLPLGADVNTAVYRVADIDNVSFFLKLRKGAFDRTSVMLPRFFSEQGIRQIIPPLQTVSGGLWGDLDAYKTVLYPFVNGRNGYEATLSERHWVEFGSALGKIHSATLPPDVAASLRRETFSAYYRELVLSFLSIIDEETYCDAVAGELAVFMQEKWGEILNLIERAEQLAHVLKKEPPPFIVCHSDIHAGNIYIDDDDALYIVDWDEPILAPKERDLMYIGGGLLDSGLSPQEEECQFYEAYGHVEVSRHALAYYRLERIVQDIAAYCEQLLLSDEGGADREQSLVYFKSNFLPGGTVEIANETYDSLSSL
ncbi:MAG: phosphotransferase [Candidatus Promineifilaceae bacterium]|jgi:spectinomycin phosphotransferase